MEWMSDWVRQIILIIFIATFIDLLLPSSSLDRYVKLVMGLIIIMAILQPILKLVITDHRWKNFSSIIPPTMSNNTYATLDEIRAESRQLSQVKKEEVNRRFQTSITNWIRQQVSEKFHVEVVSAKVITEFQKEDVPVVKQILVVATKQAKDSSIQAVEPIQPVEINKQASRLAPAEPRDTKLQTAIRKYIEAVWDLADEQVVVQVNSP